MKTLFTFLYKLFKKSVALFALSVIAIFYFTLYIVFFLFRFLAVPLAAFGTVMNVVDSYVYGFTAERGLILLFLLAVVAVRYLIPLLISFIKDLKEILQDYISEPLVVRPPVRYTIY